MPDLTQRHIPHLTLDERIEIQDCLYHGMTFKAIAKRIGRDQTTVSKEVKKHIHVTAAVNPNAQPCGKLMSAPFVCNGCTKHRYCKLERHFYYAKEAQDAYKSTLSECRSGVALSKEAFYESDKIIAAGIRNGQHIYHIAQTNSLSFSKSSFYRYLHKGYLSVSPIDMPRVVKFKQRNTPKATYVPKKLKEGRTYDCFQAYI